MVSAFVKSPDKVIREKDIKKLPLLDINDIVWIEMYSPSELEKAFIEDFMKINLQTRQQLEEIETSSRFLEKEDQIIVNSNFFNISHNIYEQEPISFILKNNILVSMRNFDSRTFNETIKKVETNHRLYTNGFHIFVALFETRIDLDADLLENIAKDISNISKVLRTKKNLDEETIINITDLQEKTMMIRENVIDKQRVISGILKSESFPPESYPRIRVMIKDITSLIDYTAFYFNRLEYLQDSFLGLINLEQNKIIKIFTVASVVFMPPTLIASMYGMNFEILPELNWQYGYPFAIGLMIFSSLITLWIFRRKRWL